MYSIGIKLRMRSCIDRYIFVALQIKTSLDTIDEENTLRKQQPGHGEGTAYERMHSSVTRGLKQNFNKRLSPFRALQEHIHQENRELIKRRVYTVTGNWPNEEAIDRLMETGQDEYITRIAIEHGRAGQAGEIEGEKLIEKLKLAIWFVYKVKGVSCLDPDEFVTIEDVHGAVVAGPYSFVLKKRLASLHTTVEKLLFVPEQNEDHVGNVSDQSKPMIFSMARLDHVKNISGLVEWYAKNSKLRELANLVVVAGYNEVKRSSDREEILEIEKMHDLFKKYKLDGQVRWISAQTNHAQNGEVYHYIADGRGVFVQAMTCGFPTFITCHGDPTKIIEDGVSGFHIDPYHPDSATVTMANFFEKCKKEPEYRLKISEGGYKRINERQYLT
ncbi:sucrose synthase 2 [Tanacetum coccineum]